MSACRCCGDPVKDLAKRFDADFGFICPTCHAAMNDDRLDEALRKVGIVGSAPHPKEDVA